MAGPLPELIGNWDQLRERLVARVRVLVIDDEPTVGQVLEMVLSDASFAVECVSTAEEGWELLEETPTDRPPSLRELVEHSAEVGAP